MTAPQEQPFSDRALLLLHAGLSHPTRSTYATGVRAYQRFCDESGVPVGDRIPANEARLIEFVAWCSTTVAPPTIKVYLSAVRSWHVDNGYGDPTIGRLQLERVVRGAQRIGSQPRQVRLPLTIEILRRIWAVEVDQGWDDVMFRAAISLGFFGFLRLGELTLPTATTPFDPRVHATVGDLTFGQHAQAGPFVAFRIKVSKTDPFRQGSTVHLGTTGMPICPVNALSTYLTYRPVKAQQGSSLNVSPLFIDNDGRILTKAVFIAMMRVRMQTAGLDAHAFSGHSLRIGAATTAAAAGLPDWLIKAMGRWKSDAYLRYVRTPVDQVLAVSGKLASSTVGRTVTTNHLDLPRVQESS